MYTRLATLTKRLQKVQNALARAVTKTPKTPPHYHVLKSLHLLKVPLRIHCKVVSLTYKRHSHLFTLLHSPVTRYPTVGVYSFITVSASMSRFQSHPLRNYATATCLE